MPEEARTNQTPRRRVSVDRGVAKPGIGSYGSIAPTNGRRATEGRDGSEDEDYSNAGTGSAWYRTLTKDASAEIPSGSWGTLSLAGIVFS